MNTLKDYVNFKLTHADKVAEAEGYPLKMENCKKYKKMKQLMLYGNTVQDGTPTPDAPVDVVSVGEKSVNLLEDAREIYNGNGAEDGIVANLYEELIEDGRECVRFNSSRGGIKYTKIKFKENTQYTFSFDCKCVKRNGYSSYPNYDIALVIYYTTGSYRAITVTNDSVWRRITFTSFENTTIDYIGLYSFDYRDFIYVDINTFQIEEGSTATEYEPYGKYKIPVVQRGINLFDKDNVVRLYSSVTVQTNPTETGISCTCGTNNGYFFFLIDLGLASDFEGETISAIMNCPSVATEKFGATSFVICESNGSNRVQISNATVSGDEVFTSATISTGYTTQRLCLRLYVNNISGGVSTFYFNNIMVYIGADKLPYEPYIEPVTTNIFIDEPLRKLGDYADYIDYKNKKVVRNIKEFMLKGGEVDYIGHNTIGNYLMVYTTDNNKDVNSVYFEQYIPNKYPELCTHFVTTSYRIESASTPLNSWFIRTAGDIVINTAYETFASDGVETTVEDMNNWLASQYENGTPVIFNYILKESTQEPITCELPKLNAKTSVIEVDTNLTPSNAYGKYIKR